MKFQVGDLVLVKHYKYKYRLLRPRRRLHPRLRPRSRLYDYPELCNSYGIITAAIKHSDAWQGESTSDDNAYVWFSQVDGKEYFFCEDELTGEVVE